MLWAWGWGWAGNGEFLLPSLPPLQLADPELEGNIKREGGGCGEMIGCGMEQAGTGLLNHKDFLSWLSTQFNLERKGWWHPRAEGQQEICAFFLVLSLFCEVHIQTQKG